MSQLIFRQIMQLRLAFSVGLAAIAALITGCGGGGGHDANQLTGTVRIDGSSTVFPITEAVAEEFMREHPRVRVTVGVSGTGGGFAKFSRGETDISNASRPIGVTEIAAAQENGVDFIELPVAYDGLAVLTHPSNDWVECLTVDELRRIWIAGSDIDRWNQVRSDFPDRPISLYGPGTDSGTYDYFTQAITGEEGNSRADFTASEDDNVLVQGIAGDANALGFFGLAYYENNQDRLRLVEVDGGNGCVAPTMETVSEGSYQPLSRPEFIYVRADRAQDPAVEAFVNFYLENAPALVQEVGYIPLEPESYQIAQRRFQQGATGTLFGGEHSRSGQRVLETLQAAGDGGTAPAAADTVGAGV